MNIIIVGCGKVGQTIAKSLVNESHNIVCVDREERIINKITSEIDCMGMVGNGAIQSVLIEAGVEEAAFLIACTNSDEVNILTCLMTRKISKCKTIARIRNTEYAKQIEYIMKELDISLIINPEKAAANEIVRMLRYPSSISSDAFFNGRLNLLKVEVPNDSVLINSKLYEIPKKFGVDVLVCVVERDGEVYVPTGSFIVNKGDKICFVTDHQNAIAFFGIIGVPYKQLKTFMIIGGGRITEYLVDIVMNQKNKYDIKVIDYDRKVCENLAEKYPKISVVCGDATDVSLLTKEGMRETDAFITLTGMDEENIILSLCAHQSEKVKVISKVDHLNFIDVFKDVNVGNIVNPERIVANIIILYVRAAINSWNDNNIDALYRLCDDKIEALSFSIKSKSAITNVKLKDLKFKPNVLIVGIYRDNKVIIPKGYDEIKVYDKVVIITKDYKFNDIVDVLEDSEKVV